MIQRRICSYHKPGCNHVAAQPTTFLDLPEQLRDAIYSYAGVATDSILRIKRRSLPYDVTEQEVELLNPSIAGVFHITGLGRKQVFCIDPDNDMSEDYEIYHNLRQSSRFVCADVARYLFSNNEMLVCCVDYTDLTVLLDSPVDLDQAIRRLTIHLDTRSKHSARCRNICCHSEPGAQHNLNHCVDLASGRFRATMLVWRKVIKRLAAAADLSKLQLRILCGREETVALQQILEPLKEIDVSPVAIRLEGADEPALTRLARQAVLGPNGHDQPFRFLDLPRELRLHILRFTDLVTPSHKVQFPAYNNFSYKRIIYLGASSSCTSRDFCNRDHPVYPPCICWVPPMSIFLVCREMLPEARTVFFESNGFVVPQVARYTIELPLHAEVFLRKIIPQEALQNLRDLYIYFPLSPLDPVRSDEPIYAQWVEVIDYVAPHMKTLDLQLHFVQRPWDRFRTFFVKAGTLEEWRRGVFRAQERVVRELPKLNCLRALSITAARSHDDLGIGEQEFLDYEQRLEAMVMGAGYRSTRPKRQ